MQCLKQDHDNADANNNYLIFLLSHSHFTVLQASQEIIVLRNTLLFRMRIVK